MEERSWWDLWNTSYRLKDTGDPISGQLFAHVVSLVGRLNKGRPGRLLEVACGTGTISRQLDFSVYHGLDLSAAAIEIAQTKAHEHWQGRDSAATYEAADFHNWSLHGEPVDLLLCVDAISCFRDQSLVVRRMAGMLRGGGHLVMTTVNPIVYNRIRRVGTVRLENGPVSHWLSRRELHGLVRQAGLSIERSYTIMPRGNMGWLRIINSPRLNEAFGPRFNAFLRRAKERAGIGQYRVVVARKD
jgi:2-polyprenyl-3-methyl-5-hydroxy-6-metoxy-1,4-benzoquinol methylase